MHKFLECYVPISACNMRCKYCYVTQNGWWDNKKEDFSFVNRIKEAFSKERLGGQCMINMCATGETLLYPEVLDIVKIFLENDHYVMLVTNGTMTERFKTVCEWPESIKKHLFFKLSFHYLELKRISKLDEYFENIRMLHDAGVSFTVELTPDDSYVPYIDEIKKICFEELGTLCHVTVCRDETKKGYPLMSSMSKEEFVDMWSGFNSELFSYKYSIFEEKRKEFCYAGLWSAVIDLKSGDYRQCYKGKALGNIYDMTKPLNFVAIGHNCREGHCFNGHAFLGFGLIPGLDTVDFADMRDRTDGVFASWLSPEMDSFMRTKLYEYNKELADSEKIISDIKSISLMMIAKKVLGKM